MKTTHERGKLTFEATTAEEREALLAAWDDWLALGQMHVADTTAFGFNVMDPKRIVYVEPGDDNPLAKQLMELEASADLRYAADMRAIKAWQEAHPGNDLVWPDHVDLVTWLLGQLSGLADAMVDTWTNDGSTYWAHGEGCPKRYNVNLDVACTCGVDHASLGLDAIVMTFTTRPKVREGEAEIVRDEVEVGEDGRVDG